MVCLENSQSVWPDKVSLAISSVAEFPLTSTDLRDTTPDNPVYGLAKPTQVVDHCRVGWVAGLRGIDGDIDDDAVFAERIWDLAKEAAAVTD